MRTRERALPVLACLALHPSTCALWLGRPTLSRISVPRPLCETDGFLCWTDTCAVPGVSVFCFWEMGQCNNQWLITHSARVSPPPLRDGCLPWCWRTSTPDLESILEREIAVGICQEVHIQGRLHPKPLVRPPYLRARDPLWPEMKERP